MFCINLKIASNATAATVLPVLLLEVSGDTPMTMERGTAPKGLCPRQRSRRVRGIGAVPEGSTDRTLRQTDLWLEEYHMHSTWRTRAERASVIPKLAPNGPSVAEAFLRGIAEKDPAPPARLRTGVP